MVRSVSIHIIIQARMSSARLPGKMLRPLGARPMLGILTDNLQHSRYPVAVTTSAEPSDDPIAAFCEEQDLPCIRGPLEDVAARFSLAAETLGCEAFVRICGDSPLLDYRLIDRGVTLFCEEKPDLVTNVFPRTFPKGQSVEIISVSAFNELRSRMSTADHREHVTPLFYERPQDFKIVNFSSEQDWQGFQLSVDTAQDFARIERLVSSLDHPLSDYTWEELAQMARSQSGRNTAPCTTA